MKPYKVLAVASGGGHWVQLFRMRTSWNGCVAAYVTTNKDHKRAIMSDASYRGQPTPKFYDVVSADRWTKLRLVQQALQMLIIVLKERPDVVISSGAALGVWAILFGRCQGARAAWVDSIANAQKLSLSGKIAGRMSNLWLTQWKHLEGCESSATGRPIYRGSVV